ncbi:HAD hydrolase-like protein [Miniphocaeibacter massiliensis]|uniref:HAD hydrolase-like protein n=1 Tax=Miniphocaeibacter massiliensis TaxID=2041841 RepID=UPI000C1C79DC|nr:HAD hydrolase-like protein [Miniphocaeibacter massiliensis]
MDKKYILFDLDGTIVDSGKGIKSSIKYSLKKLGIEENREEILNDFIGPPLIDSYIKHYNFSEEEADDIMQIYREYYKDNGLYENFIYEGIEEVICELKDKGNEIILATSKPEIFARRVLEQHKLTKYFDFISGATLDHKISKKTDVIKYILDNYRIEIEKAYMIGDTKYDILGGKSFGLKTVGVTYGYGSKKELEISRADYIVEDTYQIFEILKNI